jgi:CoA:oxalate CoA-transferase
MAQPLNGIRVIDFSHFMAGPFTSYLLRLLGAEVIKVEPPGGDPFRKYGNDPDYGDMGAAFIGTNAGKKSIAVDLKNDQGVEAIRRLIGTADVVLENFRPGVIGKLGFSYESCKQIKPDIIFCSISGYGQQGPMRDYPAIDNVVQATSGMMSVGGEADSPPMRIGVPVADTYAGTTAAIALLAAIIQRDRFGGGQYIDVAMLDSSLLMLYGAVTPYLVTGKVPPRRGNVGYSAQPTTGLFTGSDGQLVSLGVAQQSAFEKLCRILDRSDLLADPRFSDSQARIANGAELVEILRVEFAERPAEEWEKELSSVGIPCGLVRDIAAAVELPQVKDRHLKIPIHVPGLPNREDVHVLNTGFQFEHDGPGLDEPPPHIGQHTRELLLSLGYSESDIDGLLSSGAVSDAEVRGSGQAAQVRESA